MKKECKEPVINVSKQEAKNIALEAFNKYNKEGTVTSEMDLVYADNKIDKEASQIYEVCYTVIIDGKNDKNTSVNWKIFVSVESGKVLNILKDGAEKDVKTN